MNSEAKEIVKAIKALATELKQIRKIMESWDEEPKLDDEADPDKFIM